MKKSIAIYAPLFLSLIIGIFLFVPKANASNSNLKEHSCLVTLTPELEGKVEVQCTWWKTTEWPEVPEEAELVRYRVKSKFVIKNLSNQWIMGMCESLNVKDIDGNIIRGGARSCRSQPECRHGIPPDGRSEERGTGMNVSLEEYDRIESVELIITKACFCNPPPSPNNVKVENISTEDELRLKISWTNPPDRDIKKIYLCRSNQFIYLPYSPGFVHPLAAGTLPWICNYISRLKDIPENSDSIIDNYLSPSAASIIDNFKLVSGIEYYYTLVTEAPPPVCELGEFPSKYFENFSIASKEVTAIPQYADTLSLKEIMKEIKNLKMWQKTTEAWKAEVNESIAKIWKEIQALWDKLNWLIEKVLPPGLLKAQPGEGK